MKVALDISRPHFCSRDQHCKILHDSLEAKTYLLRSRIPSKRCSAMFDCEFEMQVPAYGVGGCRDFTGHVQACENSVAFVVFLVYSTIL